MSAYEELLAEVDRLRKRDHLLTCLEAAGIDNTEAYAEGMRMFLDERDGEES